MKRPMGLAPVLLSSVNPWSCTVQDFEKAGQLRDREMELKAQISAITGAAKETTDAEAETTAEGGGPLVTEADIAHIVAQWTGIPVEKVRWAETHVPRNIILSGS